MPKTVNSMDGMTLQDLMSEDGFVVNVSDGRIEEEPDPFPYHPNVDLSNDQMIKVLNMEEFAEDDIEGTNNTGETMPWSISFEKIRVKSQDLTNNGGVMKLIKQQGIGEIVPPDCLTILHFCGYFEYQDEPFDSTFARGSPARIRLNDGQLLWGLEIGIRTMKKHETACFVISPDYAYGELGCVPLIPPNSEVLFIVHMLDFIDGGSAETLENLSREERMQFANVKIRAVAEIRKAAESFKRLKTRQAIREYSRAVDLLEAAKLENDEEEDEMKKLLSRAYGNLAVCYNKEDKPRLACKACLSVPNPTAKTYFHHGRAMIKMGEYKRALEQLQCSLRLDPKNTRTMEEIDLANEHQRKHAEAEKRLWVNCLRVRNGEQTVNQYEQYAKEFCESFAKNESILRQPLHEGLTPAECKCIRHQAALLGLNVVQTVRYGKETTYIAKTNY